MGWPSPIYKDEEGYFALPDGGLDSFKSTVEVPTGPKGPKTKLKGTGTGQRKKDAQQEAAREVMESRQLRKQLLIYAAAGLTPREEGASNPKGQLQEVVAKGLLKALGVERSQMPEYVTVSVMGSPHMPLYTERVILKASSKGMASPADEDGEGEEGEDLRAEAVEAEEVFSAEGMDHGKKAAQGKAAEALLLLLKERLEKLSRSTKL